LILRDGFKKKVGSLSEGSVPVKFISMIMGTHVYNLHLEVQVCAGRRLDYTMTAEIHTKLE
jgi:hypothetical protein